MIVLMRGCTATPKSDTLAYAIRNVSHVEHFDWGVEITVGDGDCEEIGAPAHRNGCYERGGLVLDFLTVYDDSAEAALRESYPKCRWEN